MAGARILFSYKHNHEPSLKLMGTLRGALLNAGYEVLVDDGIRGGDCWSSALYGWLLDCAGAVVLASPEAKQSEWCRREWEVLAARAAVNKSQVVPVLMGLPGGELGPLAEFQGLDSARMSQEALAEKLLEALRVAPPWRVSTDDVMSLHRAWLRWQYRDAPVLGKEPFTLADVYIATDCGQRRWEQLAPDMGKGDDPFREAKGDRLPLLDTVMGLLCQPTKNVGEKEAIVVQGPAGSGKSAFTLHLANHLIDQGFEPLVVRFRDMRLAVRHSVEELLGDAMRVGPESEPTNLPTIPILAEERLRLTKRLGNVEIGRTVVILDGWDEVSLAGSAGYQAQLETWLARFRQFFVERPGPPVRLVVTGRPSLEVKESGFLRKQTPVLTLRPMRPEQLEKFTHKLCSVWKSKRAVPAEVFTRYRDWFEDQEGSGVEMLGQPLLALLAVRIFGEHDGDLDELLNAPSALYQALIDQTCPQAGKVDRPRVDRPLEGTVHRGGTALRRLLQKTAAIISVFWTERVSFEEMDARLDGNEDLKNWVDEATTGNPLHALVVNFWFKGGHNDLGCEFLHKSFREYLFAEAIVASLLVLSEDQAGPLPPLKLKYWQDFPADSLHGKASRTLAEFLSPQWLTPEVRSHLFWLIERAIKKESARWEFLRDLLADVYGWWAEGVHLRPQLHRIHGKVDWATPAVCNMVRWAMPYRDDNAEPMRTTTVDAHLGDALMQLTAFVHWQLNPTTPGPSLAPVSGRGYQVTDGSKVWFCPGQRKYFRNLVARISAASRRPGGPDVVGSYLRGIVLDDEALDGLQAEHADLAGSGLDAHSLFGADLSGTNCKGARFIGSRMWAFHRGKAGVSFHRGPSLRRTHLAAADLRDADLRNVDFPFNIGLIANVTGARMETLDPERVIAELEQDVPPKA